MGDVECPICGTRINWRAARPYRMGADSRPNPWSGIPGTAMRPGETG